MGLIEIRVFFKIRIREKLLLQMRWPKSFIEVKRIEEENLEMEEEEDEVVF